MRWQQPGRVSLMYNCSLRGTCLSAEYGIRDRICDLDFGVW
jgi:hypothetical protein